MQILGTYKNGNYQVTIFSDGTKVRRTDDDEFIPEFPENADVKITDKCSQGCPFCYEGCTKQGEHSYLMCEDGTFGQYWMYTLKPYTELAINGNDLDHPDLDKFLLKMQELHIIVNVTVNQNQFMNHLDYLKYLVKYKMVYGVGVSLVDSSDDKFFEALKEFPNAVIHTIAGILGSADIMRLMNNHSKVLILGYKNLGRGINYRNNVYNHVEDYIKQLQYWLPANTRRWDRRTLFHSSAGAWAPAQHILIRRRSNVCPHSRSCVSSTTSIKRPCSIPCRRCW